jgi:hypothetical protein
VSKVDVAPAATVRAIVGVRNAGDMVWPDDEMGDPVHASGRRAVHVCARWLDAGGGVVSAFACTPLPFPILPAQAVEIPLSLAAPSLGGIYRLQLDLVQESVAWFGDVGSTRPTTTVRVRSES